MFSSNVVAVYASVDITKLVAIVDSEALRVLHAVLELGEP